MPTLELHYTEWSTSPSSEDNVHDAYHSAAFILDKIKGTENSANSMSYWVFTDIFEEMGIRPTPFHGGFGLMNYQGIKKPAYFAYNYLNQLGETELANSDSASWVCKSKNGNVQALVYNFTITHPGDSVANQVFYKRDLPAKSAGKVQLILQQVPAGKYRCKIFKTGYRVNDAYSTYLDEGSPAQLSTANEKRIKSINNGEPIAQQIVEVNASGTFSGEYEIRENDVLLIVLEKL
jgi:xylan 1,4-beta-xylosidase